MGFIKSLFSKKEPTPTRILSHPNQLQLNDIFTMGDSFALPSSIRKQQLQVVDIKTIEFKHEHFVQVAGQGSLDELVYISFPKNPHRQIKVSLLLKRIDVEALFSLDDFSEIFEEPGKAILKPLTTKHKYADMLSCEYIQKDFMTGGYLHSKDFRGSTPPQFNEDCPGEEFEYYSLEGKEEKRSIDIFIFENGETDVYLSSLRDPSDVAELWAKED